MKWMNPAGPWERKTRDLQGGGDERMGRIEQAREERLQGWAEFRGTGFQIVRTLDLTVMLIFSSCFHVPMCVCCFFLNMFNKIGITASPPLSSAPGFCDVECLLLSASLSTHTATKPI